MNDKLYILTSFIYHITSFMFFSKFYISCKQLYILQQVLIVRYNLYTKTKKSYSKSKMLYRFNLKFYMVRSILIQTAFHNEARWYRVLPSDLHPSPSIVLMLYFKPLFVTTFQFHFHFSFSP